MTTANLELAINFFAAAQSGDDETLRSVCADDIAVRQNSGSSMGFAALAGMGRAARRAAPDFRYENAVRADTGTGFVEEHDVCGTLADGTTFRVAVCVVATVSNGRIGTMHEYVDTREAQSLITALSAGAN